MTRLEGAMVNNRCIVAATEECERKRLAGIMDKLGFEVVPVWRRSQLPAQCRYPSKAIVMVNDGSPEGDDLVLAVRGLPLWHKQILLELAPNEDAEVIRERFNELEVERKAFKKLRAQDRLERMQARCTNLEPLPQVLRLEAAE